jgi:hypothetical protein
MKISAFKTIAGVLTLTGLMALPALAADAISSSVNMAPAPAKLSGDEWRALSLASSRVLKHTDQAVTALADKKNDAALANIAQGLKLVAIIDAAMPVTTVTTEIKGGGLTYQDNDPVKPTFVPIYREYDAVDIMSPIMAQKQAKAGASRSAAVPDVAYAAFDYTGVKLNVRLAKRDLQAAEDLIKQGDTKGATAALQDILGNGVIFTFSTMDEPLVRAMDNLRLADSEFMAKHPDQAKAALAGASDALKNYEKLTGDTHSKEVALLHREIEGVAANLAAEKPETFSKKVSDWWSRCLNWLPSY